MFRLLTHPLTLTGTALQMIVSIQTLWDRMSLRTLFRSRATTFALTSAVAVIFVLIAQHPASASLQSASISTAPNTAMDMSQFAGSTGGLSTIMSYILNFGNLMSFMVYFVVPFYAVMHLLQNVRQGVGEGGQVIQYVGQHLGTMAMHFLIPAFLAGFWTFAKTSLVPLS